MPNEMIERVAASLHVEGLMVPYAGLPEIMKDKYRMMAKRAIEAMREPTDEMLKAFYGDMPCEQWLGNDWRDMIDAALKE